MRCCCIWCIYCVLSGMLLFLLQTRLFGDSLEGIGREVYRWGRSPQIFANSTKLLEVSRTLFNGQWCNRVCVVFLGDSLHTTIHEGAATRSSIIALRDARKLYTIPNMAGMCTQGGGGRCSYRGQVQMPICILVVCEFLYKSDRNVLMQNPNVPNAVPLEERRVYQVSNSMQNFVITPTSKIQNKGRLRQ